MKNDYSNLSAENEMHRLAGVSYPELSETDVRALEASIDVMTQNPVGQDRITMTFNLNDVRSILSAFDVALSDCPALEQDLSLLAAKFITARACLS